MEMSYYNGKKGAFNISGLPGVSDVYQVTTTSTSAGPYTFWNKWFKPRGNMQTTIAAAEALLTGGINEVILLSPESHSLASMLTWDKSNSALIGECPDATMMNQRARIGMSANFATMMTISGSGNLFKNLYFMHGRGSATNLNCITVTGDRNVFENVNFAGPQNATEGAAAGYDLIRLDGAEETVFKRCVFGTHNTSSTTYTGIEFQSDAGTAIFEDCIFWCAGGAAGNGRFLKFDAGIGIGAAIFKNCVFINIGTALTYGIDGTGLNNYKVVLLNSDFTGCTDVVAADYESYVLSAGGSALRSSDAVNSLMVAYDHTD
jgi:hypothetical protein